MDLESILASADFGEHGDGIVGRTTDRRGEFRRVGAQEGIGRPFLAERAWNRWRARVPQPRHFARADMAEPAIRYWLWAGKRAVRGWALVEAAEHFSEGIRIAASLPPSPQRQRLVFEAEGGAAGQQLQWRIDGRTARRHCRYRAQN